MRQTRSVTRRDPYSYLAEDWINHEWLTEIVFATLYDIFGTPGLIGLKVAFGMVMVGVIYWILCRSSLDALRAGMGALLTTWLLYVGMRPVRPQLFTYLLFMAVLLVLKAYGRGHRKRLLLLLPPIFMLWTNFHGGFLAGLGVLFIWSGMESITTWLRARQLGSVLRESWPLLAASAGSLAATGVNPYGLDLLRFLLRTATVPRPEITEWAPLGISSVEGIAYLIFLTLVGFILARRGRDMSASALAVLGVTLLLPLMAVRHLPLAAIAGAVLVGDHAGSVFRRKEGPRGKPWLHRGMAAAAGMAGVTFAAVAVPNFGCIHVGPPEADRYPTGAVHFLDQAPGDINLAVFFNWGEYVIWHLGPRVQVSMDGRRETVYPDSIYREYFDFLYGTGRWDALLDDRPSDAALLPKTYPTFNLIRAKAGWELVYEDSLSGLFAREGSSFGTPLAGTTAPQSGAQCFP